MKALITLLVCVSVACIGYIMYVMIMIINGDDRK